MSTRKADRTGIFDQALKVRIAPPSGNYDFETYDFDLGTYVSGLVTPFYAVQVQKNGNTDETQTATSWTLLKVDGSAGVDTKIDRTGNGIWPFYPSTLYYPDPSSTKATLGVLYVTEDFLKERELTLDAYGIGGKWPIGLDQSERKDALGALVGITSQIDVNAWLKSSPQGRAVLTAIDALKSVHP